MEMSNSYLPLPHLLVTSVCPTKNFVLQPPQLSKTQLALRKFGHISSSQAVAALVQVTRGTLGGHDPPVIGGAIVKKNQKNTSKMITIAIHCLDRCRSQRFSDLHYNLYLHIVGILGHTGQQRPRGVMVGTSQIGIAHNIIRQSTRKTNYL